MGFKDASPAQARLAKTRGERVLEQTPDCPCSLLVACSALRPPSLPTVCPRPKAKGSFPPSPSLRRV